MAILRFFWAIIRTVLRAIVTVAVLICLMLLGTNIYSYFRDGPWTSPAAASAAMPRLAGLDLADDSNSIDDLVQALGPPEHVAVSDTQKNLHYYRWYRDAVRASVLDNTPISILIDDAGLLQILPLSKPKFPGAFLGLRIGAPAPTAVEAAALRQRADQCCQAESLTWGDQNGRVSSINYQRSVIRVPQSQGR